MRASELMIGDWVYILNFPERGKKTPVKIIGMDTNHNAIEYVHNGIRLWSAVVRLEPIQITPEILIKIGFKKLKSAMGREYYEIPMENVIIHYDTDFSGRIQSPNRNFEFLNVVFLHELQHALRLCGITKEIEL